MPRVTHFQNIVEPLSHRHRERVSAKYGPQTRGAPPAATRQELISQGLLRPNAAPLAEVWADPGKPEVKVDGATLPLDSRGRGVAEAALRSVPGGRFRQGWQPSPRPPAPPPPLPAEAGLTTRERLIAAGLVRPAACVVPPDGHPSPQGRLDAPTLPIDAIGRKAAEREIEGRPARDDDRLRV